MYNPFSFRFRLFESYRNPFKSHKSSSYTIDSSSSSHNCTTKNRCSYESSISPSSLNTVCSSLDNLALTSPATSSADSSSGPLHLSSLKSSEGVYLGHSSSTTEDHCIASSLTKTR